MGDIPYHSLFQSSCPNAPSPTLRRKRRSLSRRRDGRSLRPDDTQGPQRGHTDLNLDISRAPSASTVTDPSQIYTMLHRENLKTENVDALNQVFENFYHEHGFKDPGYVYLDHGEQKAYIKSASKGSNLAGNHDDFNQGNRLVSVKNLRSDLVDNYDEHKVRVDSGAEENGLSVDNKFSSEFRQTAADRSGLTKLIRNFSRRHKRGEKRDLHAAVDSEIDDGNKVSSVPGISVSLFSTKYVDRPGATGLPASFVENSDDEHLLRMGRSAADDVTHDESTLTVGIVTPIPIVETTTKQSWWDWFWGGAQTSGDDLDDSETTKTSTSSSTQIPSINTAVGNTETLATGTPIMGTVTLKSTVQQSITIYVTDTSENITITTTERGAIGNSTNQLIADNQYSMQGHVMTSSDLDDHVILSTANDIDYSLVDSETTITDTSTSTWVTSITPTKGNIDRGDDDDTSVPEVYVQDLMSETSLLTSAVEDTDDGSTLTVGRSTVSTVTRQHMLATTTKRPWWSWFVPGYADDDFEDSDTTVTSSSSFTQIPSITPTVGSTEPTNLSTYLAVNNDDNRALSMETSSASVGTSKNIIQQGITTSTIEVVTSAIPAGEGNANNRAIVELTYGTSTGTTKLFGDTQQGSAAVTTDFTTPTTPTSRNHQPSTGQPMQSSGLKSQAESSTTTHFDGGYSSTAYNGRESNAVRDGQWDSESSVTVSPGFHPNGVRQGGGDEVSQLHTGSGTDVLPETTPTVDHKRLVPTVRVDRGRGETVDRNGKSYSTDTKMSFWRNCHHWLHWKLSFDNFRWIQWRRFRQNDIFVTTSRILTQKRTVVMMPTLSSLVEPQVVEVN